MTAADAIRAQTAALKESTAGLDAAIDEMERETALTLDRLARMKKAHAAAQEAKAALDAFTASIAAPEPAKADCGALTAAAVEAQRQAQVIDLTEGHVAPGQPAREWPEAPLGEAETDAAREEIAHWGGPAAEEVLAAPEKPATNGKRRRGDR